MDRVPNAKRPEYEAWRSMNRRCYTPSNGGFRSHGAKGVSVCARWRASFADFLADVGPRPSPQHSLDRIDATCGYEPGNVRWATWEEQNSHTSRNTLISVGSERLTAAQWSRRLGGHRLLVTDRIRKGWDPVRAASTPRGG